MSKVPKKKWTDDEREFDRLVKMMDSKQQMIRIDGRIAFKNFEKRFTKEVLDKMWERIK